MRSHIALATLALTLAVPPVASAATVEMKRVEERDSGETYVYGEVEADAAPGETNTMTVEQTDAAPGSPDSVTVTDTTAPVTAVGDYCQQLDPNRVRCQEPGIPDISNVIVDLGDMDDTAGTGPDGGMYLRIEGGTGDDELTAAGYLYGGAGNDTVTSLGGTSSLHGEDGDDVLQGTDGDEYLDGGTGDDVMRGEAGDDHLYAGGSAGEPGAAGRDRLEGGAGNDVLSDEDGLAPPYEIGPDVLIGGEGSDWVSSYIGRLEPVRIDLTTPEGNGQADENDTLDGLEHADGGHANDVMIGNDEPNHLIGNAGRDLMRGGGGNDRFWSLPGAEMQANARAKLYGPDRVFGDAGNDVIETRVTMESRVHCGDGDDSIEVQGYVSEGDTRPPTVGPLVSQTCEQVDNPSGRRKMVMAPTPVDVRRRRLVFGFLEFRCCTHVLKLQRLKSPHRTIAKKRVRGERVSLRVPRRLIRRSETDAIRLRLKVTRVSASPFLWRFEFGEGAF